jgi:hypothetical protein
VRPHWSSVAWRGPEPLAFHALALSIRLSRNKRGDRHDVAIFQVPCSDPAAHVAACSGAGS